MEQKTRDPKPYFIVLVFFTIGMIILILGGFYLDDYSFFYYVMNMENPISEIFLNSNVLTVHYRPIPMFLFYMLFSAFGINVIVYNIVSFILVIFLIFSLYRLTKTLNINYISTFFVFSVSSFFIAFIYFFKHCWFDLMMVSFGLLALSFYLKGDMKNKIIGLLILNLSFLSKETGLMVLIFIVMYEIFINYKLFFKQIWKFLVLAPSLLLIFYVLFFKGNFGGGSIPNFVLYPFLKYVFIIYMIFAFVLAYILKTKFKTQDEHTKKLILLNYLSFGILLMVSGNYAFLFPICSFSLLIPKIIPQLKIRFHKSSVYLLLRKIKPILFILLISCSYIFFVLNSVSYYTFIYYQNKYVDSIQMINTLENKTHLYIFNIPNSNNLRLHNMFGILNQIYYPDLNNLTIKFGITEDFKLGIFFAVFNILNNLDSLNILAFNIYTNDDIVILQSNSSNIVLFL